MNPIIKLILIFSLNLPLQHIVASKPQAENIKSWQKDRFGMFIHWGPVSLVGKEIGWSRAGERRGFNRPPGTEVPAAEYDNLYKKFNPTEFDAKEWVRIAKAAGMKYMVFTSRHHDGFNMFDTQVNDYKITSQQSPFRRDVLKELADACHAAGMRFGIYYSQPDWRHPDAFVPERHGYFLEYLKTQLRELLTNYGKVDILWYDGLGRPPENFDALGMSRLARKLQPSIMINNRNGLLEDFDTPEQRIGKYQDDRPWESCMTICRQWAWKPNDTMKSLEQCLQTLIRCAGGDGNLLLNVGPMPDGRIEPRQAERLTEIGDWLAQNGETIYNTRGGPWKPTKEMASTRRGNTIFLHLFRDTPGPMELPALPAEIRSVVTAQGESVSYYIKNDKLVLQIDRKLIRPNDTIIKIILSDSAMEIAPMSITEEIKGTSSNPYRKHDVRNHPDHAFDNEPRTRWSPDDGATSGWIAGELGRPRRIQRVRIEESGGERVTSFEFQYRSGNGWKTLFKGTNIGHDFQQSFDPVIAQQFRLNILSATGNPAISDIEFF